MIVPVSSDKYKNLFGKASEFLLNAKDEDGNSLFSGVKEITDLNSYYGHMKDFYDAAAQYNLKEGYRYIMMPLSGAGEEVFKVDLNLRTITVPPTFLKIGAVQSDQMAELIVFSADRYFDYMDLANTLIYVQWQLPHPDKDGNPISGATPISIIDLESEPGKMLFAWPLHKNITAQSGVIKFSLRFFLKDASEKNLIYSLNTQSANLTIHAALDVTENLQADDLSLFEFSIINSDYAEAGILPASKPIFEYPGLDLTVVDYDNCFVRYEGTGAQKKSIIAKLNADNQLQLKGQAIVNDAGQLSYDWCYYPSDEDNKCISHNEPKDDIFPGTAEIVYEKASLPIDPITRQEYLIGSERYFTKDGEEYTPYNESTIPEDKELYECYTVLTINGSKVTGDYSIVAKNSVSQNGGATQKNAETWSTHCILPSPEDIKFKDEVFTVDKENKKIKVNIVEDNNKPTYSVKWFKDVESAEKAVEKAGGADDDGLVENMGTADLAPGWYAARVSATLNKTEKVEGTKSAQVIYAAPAITSVDIVGGDGSFNLGLNEQVELKVKAVVPIPDGFEIPEEGKEDEAIGASLYRNLSYRWEYSIANNNKWSSITEKMTGPDKRFEGDVNTNSLLVRNLDQIAYAYRCIVTNTLGNEFTTAESNLFVIY